jgi:hypothetical protein
MTATGELQRAAVVKALWPGAQVTRVTKKTTTEDGRV